MYTSYILFLVHSCICSIIFIIICVLIYWS